MKILRWALPVCVCVLCVGCAQPYAAGAEVVSAELEESLRLREAAVQRFGYHCVIKYMKVPGGVRRDGEGEAEFVSRCASTQPEFTGISVPIIVARDFDSSAVYVRFGEVGQDVPKFEEHLRTGDSVTSLLGTTGSEVQATISAQLPARLTESGVGMPRIDILALRPIADRPISVVLRGAASSDAAKIPDPWGRELFKSVATADSEGRTTGRTVTLRHLETVSPGKMQNLWYRIVFSRAGDEVVIARIDALPAAGDRGTMPTLVTLLEDYRLVNRIQVPHRVRCFQFGKDGVIGSVTEVSQATVNQDVTIPAQVEIPPGTAVFDLIQNRKYRK